MGEAYIIRHLHAAILLQIQGTKAAGAGHHAQAGIHYIHVMNIGDVEQVFIAWHVEQIFQGCNLRLAGIHHQAETADIVPGHCFSELISAVLIPHECLEMTLRNQGEGLALQAKAVSFLRIDFNLAGVISQVDLL